MRWLTNSYDFRFKGTASAATGIYPTKSWLSQLVNFKNAICTLEEPYAIKFCFKLGKKGPCDESWIYCSEAETKRQCSQWQHAGYPRPKKTRQSKSTYKLLMISFFYSTGMIYMHWVPTGQIINREYYVEVLREFRKRFRRKRPALFKSSQWHFHQDNAPVHNSILVTDYLTKIGIKTVPQPPPIVQILLPVTFAYSLSSEAVVMRQLRRWKRLFRRSLTRWNKRKHGALQKLLERYNKYITAGGDYFEGD